MLTAYQLRVHGNVGSGMPFSQALSTTPFPMQFLLSSPIKKRVLAVEFETEHANDEAHVHRLAYLKLRKVHGVHANDLEQAKALFHEHRDLAREARAWRGIASFVAAVLAFPALVLGGYFAWQHQRQGVVEARAEMAGRATARGQTEVVRPPQHELFETHLANFSIALDVRSANPDREESTAEVTSKRAILEQQSPETIRSAMRHYADALDSFTGNPAAREAESDAVERAMLALNEALRVARIPYYVDTDLLGYTGRNRAFVSSYQVLHTRSLTSGQERVRALDLLRADHVNHTQRALGYTRATNREALVLVEKIEEFLLRSLLPSVHGAEQSVFVRGIEHERDTTWIADFERQIHEDLLEEARLAATERDVLDLARAVVTRKQTLDTLNSLLSHANISLRMPTGYLFDTGFLARFRRQVPERAIQEVEDAQSLLESDSVLAAYHTLEESELHSVALHEAQHRLDYNADRFVRVPDALAEWTGRTQFEDAVNQRAERSNAELSAYLSQIAREPQRAQTNLAFLLMWLMDSHGWGHVECYAALVITEQLARTFSIEHDPLVVARRIQRKPIADIYAALRQHSGEEVAAHARQLWQELYGEPLPPLDGGAIDTR